MDVKIEQLTEGEWVDFKTVTDATDKDAWDNAVKEVCGLNSEKEGKYRAVAVNGFLTHIYCSGFYTVPTIRGW